jgi:vitamin B12 transporter
MKGASNTLYGSGAATGVINITLKAGKSYCGKCLCKCGYTNGGKSVQDYNQGFAVNGGFEKVNYFASLNSTETTGISEAKPLNNDTTFENDTFF